METVSHRLTPSDEHLTEGAHSNVPAAGGQPLTSSDAPDQTVNYEHYVPEWQQKTPSMFEDFVALSTMFLIFGWGYILVPLALSLLVASLVYGNRSAAIALVIIASSSLLPASFWPSFQKHWIWRTWRSYFQLEIVRPPLPFMDPQKHYLFCEVPHGVFPMASFLSYHALGEPGTGLPADTLGMTASVLFRVPFIRHIMIWMGSVPADRSWLNISLQQHAAAGLLPEGIAGIFLGEDRDVERIFMKERKGFVKAALQNGSDIVPVYLLGQSRVFKYAGLRDLSRKLRMSIGILWGRWGLPIPFRTKLVAAIGQPIAVGGPYLNPSQKQIDELHARVIAELKKLFDGHKHLVPGLEDKELVVV